MDQLKYPAGGDGSIVTSRVTFEAPARAGNKISYLLLLLFIGLLYANIEMLFPALQPLRPMLVIAVAAIVALWVENSLGGREFALVWPESHLLLMFFGAAVLSITTALWMRQAAETTMDLAKMVIVYLLIVNTVDSEKKLRVLTWCMVLGGLIPTLATLNKYIHGDILSDGRIAWIGIFGNPNELAYSLAILIPLVIAVAYAHGFFMRMASWVIVAFYVAAVFVTFSRGGLLGLGVVLALTALRLQTSRLVPVFALVLLLAGAVFLTHFWTRGEDFSNLGSDNSFQERIATIRLGYEMFLDHPLFGVGMGCFIVGWPMYAPKDLYTRNWLVNHNTIMEVLSETGLVGIIPFLLLLGAALLQARKTARMLKNVRPDLAAIAKGLDIAFWGFLVCGMSGGFAVTWFPYLILGLISALQRIATEIPSAVPVSEGGQR